MPTLSECLQQISATPVGELLAAIFGNQGGQGGSQGGGQQFPPPMAAGVVSDAIGQALIESGNGDLVHQGTGPDGTPFNSIGPDLLNPAMGVLWSCGWPAAYRNSQGVDVSGAPVFFCPPTSVLQTATLVALQAGGGTTTRSDLGQICADKLHQLGYQDWPTGGA